MRKINKTSKNRKGGLFGLFSSCTRNWYGQCIEEQPSQVTSSQNVQGSMYNPPTPIDPVAPVAPATPATPMLVGGKRTKKNNRRKRPSGKRSVFGNVMKMFTCNKHSRRNKNKKGGVGYKPLHH